ncbi:NupC/NupG family nucleoside CNT transporter [Sporosarcina pasteurii]|uniref:Nucleoside permease nupX n=1 Tax=Sporosarcina pasteurii TaxID=1474 RepID=A0A380BJK4_SPOPA|nr:nucleoside transporter C-terminal domain-containing protein [Sporosarcina pasteurii]MDS9470704.1 nucleoside transporter C-terminal domain-containing protein [Sporosarcina pasteurii]QBQ05614.1 NupC/NupG family nucleoside CNT transporter [Sporosarcina pasteurii]SUJ01668.1 Nucleoside permease nupX [Sporosarcina pasteurii]
MVSILWGLMGCTVIVLAALLLSENKKAINIWTVSMGFIAQVILGFIVLKWDIGMSIIQWLSDGVSKVMAYGVEGLKFVFGSLADKEGAAGPIFAINALAIMIYLTALIGLLYRFGIMQMFVRIVGGGLSKIMKTGHIESTNAAANIFLGMTQSFLSVKPYIRTMSRSQLFAVMVGGLASVSGAVLLGLAAMGIPINYLLSAAIMSAPAGLMLAKLIIPETEKLDPNEWKVTDDNVNESGEKPSVMEVIVTESKDGLHFAVNAVVILVSIIGLIALLNGILGGVGSLVGLPGLSFETILGYVFAPVAFVLGIPWSEAIMAGNLLGQKIIINEFVAFAAFQDIIGSFSEKSVAILTFALSGFANLGSIGIILGVMLGIAPNRKKEIQDMAFKGLIAATLANLLNGAIVGIFFF